MTTFDEDISFYSNEQIYGLDESIPEFKYYYENGELQSYLYKGIFYTGTWPEYWAKFQYEHRVGPAHCRRCVINGSKRGVMVGPCVKCAPHYDNYELGSGFDNFGKEPPINIDGKLVPSVFDLHMKYVNLLSIGRNVEPILLNKILESACNELQYKLFEKHENEVEAIQGLMRFIKSFKNMNDIFKKINSALLIPESKMYNQNWAGTDWEWLTGQMIYDESTKWTFTDEELASIRESQENIRTLVAGSNIKNVDNIEK